MIKHTFIIFYFIRKIYKVFCIQNNMSQYYSSNQNSVSFQTICLGHYKRILEISTIEFTGGYYSYITSGNVVTKSYETDKRKEFCQAVEMLAKALYPYFDEDIKGKYDKIFGKDDKPPKQKSDKEDNEEEELYIFKNLFMELSCLLHRLDYLKGSTYSESLNDDVLEDDN